MANNYPCHPQPMQFINCCTVMDCIDIKSSDNSVTVEKSDCGIDIRITGNNLDQIIQLANSQCITWVKEFIEGKLTFTPQLDFECIAAQVCEICNPPQPPVCPSPIGVMVTVL